MLEHFKKYEIIYLIVFSAIFFILSGIFVYFGMKMNKKNSYHYSEQEAVGIMKLKADQLTRMIEIGSKEGSCEASDPTWLTDEQMETYGFDKNFYKKVTLTMKCVDEKQIVSIDIIGTGEFNGYKLTDYISNQKKN